MRYIQQYGPLICTIAGTVGAAFLTPTFVTAHPLMFAWITVAAQVLHAALPSIFEARASLK